MYVLSSQITFVVQSNNSDPHVYLSIINFYIRLSHLTFTNNPTFFLFYNFTFHHLLLREYKHSYKQACSFPTSSLRSFTCNPYYKFSILFCLPCAVSGRPAGPPVRNAQLVELLVVFTFSFHMYIYTISTCPIFSIHSTYTSLLITSGQDGEGVMVHCVHLASLLYFNPHSHQPFHISFVYIFFNL